MHELSIKSRNKVQYPSIASAIIPIPRSVELPVPNLPTEKQLMSDSDFTSKLMEENYQDDSEYIKPKLWTQEAHHNINKDLNLSKEKPEVLGSRLKQRNMLEVLMCITTAHYSHRELSAFLKIINNFYFLQWCSIFDATTLQIWTISDIGFEAVYWLWKRLSESSRLPPVPIALNKDGWKQWRFRCPL